MQELELIKSFYGEQLTARSGVKLINHIYEGLKILDFIDAAEVSKRAYCLHPILQSDEAFNANKSSNFAGINTEALILAMEYRRVANSYLSKATKADFIGFSCPEVREMLIADKVQNYKDFLLYHKDSHPRAAELDEYFNNWFDLLGVDYNKYKVA